MNSTIQIRIDNKTKEKARQKFKAAGLDLSSGIKCYLLEVAKAKAIPRIVLTENGYTLEFEARMNREIKHALKYGKSYKNAQEIFDEILK